MTCASWMVRRSVSPMRPMPCESLLVMAMAPISWSGPSAAIVAARTQKPIERTGQLATVIAAAVPAREPGKHPATRSFQAIRMRVNAELESIEAALPQAVELLAPGGRLCVIGFHSLEDRLVKRFIQRHAKPAPGNRRLPQQDERALTLRDIGGAMLPTSEETARNPRARSAVLRVAERLP